MDIEGGTDNGAKGDEILAAAADAAEAAPPLDVEGGANNGDKKTNDPPAASSNDTEEIEGDTTDSTDTDDGTGDDDDAPTPPNEDPTELILQAVNLKEEGNTFFKSGDLNKASRSYRKGAMVLKGLNKGNTGDDQVKGLLLSLQTNLSMVCFKQDKHKMSRDVASKALDVDGTSVKALYRRAVAHRKLGYPDAARSDLREALKHDPDNSAVKRELFSIKKEMDAAKAIEKERLRKAFGQSGKKGSFLYDDKEEELRKKAEAKRAKDEAEKESLKKRKAEWEDECVKRMANDEPAISFEDWEKERKTKEEEEEKTRKNAKKKEEEQKRAERRKAREAARRDSGGNDDSSDDEMLTEKELAAFRGYKKTQDGRTTSYFTREMTEDQKALIGSIAPQRIDAGGGGGNAVASPQPEPVPAAAQPEPSTAAARDVGKKGAASAWNQAGTWEERDATEWCTSRLRSLLKSATVTRAPPPPTDGESSTSATAAIGSYTATVTEVKNLTGDASVALTGGKKRYIYDYHAKLTYSVFDEGDAVVGSGTLKLPDVSSTVMGEEELEVDVMGWKKSPHECGVDGVCPADVEECRSMLVWEVRKCVQSFVRDFNEHY